MGANSQTRVLSARVQSDVFDLVDDAARLRGWDRQQVVAIGAEREARRILHTAIQTIAKYRRKARRAKRVP